MTKSIRICMVGAGRVARVHTHSLTRHISEAEVAGVVDPNPESRQTLAEQFGIRTQFENLEEALSQEQFDAVVITTPTSFHSSLAVTAAMHGKHVFLEKPMALNLAECDAIIQACTRNNVLLQLGFMRRFDPEFATAARRIQSGEIGQPMMVKSLTHGPRL